MHFQAESLVQPQTETVKAPRGGPADSWAEDETIKGPPEEAEADGVIVSDDESHAARTRGVSPIAGAFTNQTLGSSDQNRKELPRPSFFSYVPTVSPSPQMATLKPIRVV